MDHSFTTNVPTIDEIIDNFSLLDEWDDRYRYVIELGRGMSPLPELHRTEANKVQGCASQVWLATTARFDNGQPVLDFFGDSDAHIVRGSSRSCSRWYPASRPARFSAADPSRCSTGSACVNISRRSALTDSDPWSGASAAMRSSARTIQIQAACSPRVGRRCGMVAFRHPPAARSISRPRMITTAARAANFTV